MTLPAGKDPTRWLETMTRNIASDEKLLLQSTFMKKLVQFGSSASINFEQQTSLSAQVSAFKLYWALKEAFMKYTGMGLSLGLDAFVLRHSEVIDREMATPGKWGRMPLQVFVDEEQSRGHLKLSAGLQSVSLWLHNYKHQYWIALCASTREVDICSTEIDLLGEA